jgi:ribulose-phosphate 3-epimerase
MMEKVRRAKKWREAHRATFHIEVDGGIKTETAKLSIENGANVLVAGTSIFGAGDYAKAIRDLRGSG